MSWLQRFAALIDFDGAEWDAEHDRLQGEWLAAYTRAFVEIAMARGWRREDAMTWPVGIGEEAFVEAYRYEWCPRLAAEADVLSCECEPG